VERLRLNVQRFMLATQLRFIILNDLRKMEMTT